MWCSFLTLPTAFATAMLQAAGRLPKDLTTPAAQGVAQSQQLQPLQQRLQSQQGQQ